MSGRPIRCKAHCRFCDRCFHSTEGFYNHITQTGPRRVNPRHTDGAPLTDHGLCQNTPGSLRRERTVFK